MKTNPKKLPEYQTRKRLKESGTGAKKYLGQNFLIDESFLPLIISAAQLTGGDTVIEIGPGLGVLTQELVKHAGKVLSVEIDSKLIPGLKRKFSGTDNLKIVNEDILKVNINDVLPADSKYKVVANLPYNITSPVLNYFIDAPLKPVSMVIMIQKEVADTLAAAPGNMTFLSVKIRIYAKPEIVAYVPAKSFYPVPKVDSAIIKLEFHDKPLVQIKDMQMFFKFVRNGFHSPRKTVHNSLALGLNISSEEAEEILERAGISGQKRPGNLIISEWNKLYYTAQDKYGLET